jgi:hypothetical protein
MNIYKSQILSRKKTKQNLDTHSFELIKKRNTMDDFICCPICFEAYDDKVCAPLLLTHVIIEANERKESANNYSSRPNSSLI